MDAQPASATAARFRVRSRAPWPAAIWLPRRCLSGNRNFEGRVHPLVKPTSLPRRRSSWHMRWLARWILISTKNRLAPIQKVNWFILKICGPARWNQNRHCLQPGCKHVQRSLFQRVRRLGHVEGGSKFPAAIFTNGMRLQPIFIIHHISNRWHWMFHLWRTSKAHASSDFLRTRSRPITSRLLVTSLSILLLENFTGTRCSAKRLQSIRSAARQWPRDWRAAHFANIRLKNLLVAPKEGNWTKHFPDGAEMPIYDAAMKYQSEGLACDCDCRQGIRNRLQPRIGLRKVRCFKVSAPWSLNHSSASIVPIWSAWHPAALNSWTVRTRIAWVERWWTLRHQRLERWYGAEERCQGARQENQMYGDRIQGHRIIEHWGGSGTIIVTAVYCIRCWEIWWSRITKTWRVTFKSDPHVL